MTKKVNINIDSHLAEIIIKEIVVLLIKNGKIDKALNQLTITGNVYQLWQDIELIGNDLKFTPDGCGAPSVAVKPMQIACN